MEIKLKGAGLWGSYGIQQGQSLIIFFFKTLIQLYFYFFYFFIFHSQYQRGYQSQQFWAVNLNMFAWGSYVLKKRNPFQNPQIATQIVFVSSPVIFFWLKYWKVYQRKDIFGFKLYVGLWGRYRLKQGVYLVIFFQQ